MGLLTLAASSDRRREEEKKASGLQVSGNSPENWLLFASATHRDLNISHTIFGQYWESETGINGEGWDGDKETIIAFGLIKEHGDVKEGKKEMKCHFSFFLKLIPVLISVPGLYVSLFHSRF